jgi:hypothetical protein
LEHPAELAQDDNARQALLDLSAHAVSRQLGGIAIAGAYSPTF